MAKNPFPYQRIYGGMPLSADLLNCLMQRLDYIIELLPEVSSESVDTETEPSLPGPASSGGLDRTGGGDDD